MNVRLFSRLHRFTLHFSLFALIAGGIPSIASADDSDRGSDIVPVAEYSLPCEFELAGTCGWADLGTHDSGVLPTAVEPVADEPATDQQASPNPSVEASVTAIATAALGAAGVSVEQMVEPFAMVGPYLENSLESVRRLQSWWDMALADSKDSQPADENACETETSGIQQQLDAIAAQEPVDVEGLGMSVLVDASPIEEQPLPQPSAPVMAIDLLVGSSAVIASLEEQDLQQSGITVTAMDMLVGSSAIVVTLDDEDYLPYDLSERDIKLWSVFPLATQPFCVRSHVEEMDASPMWQEFDEVVVSDNDMEQQNESYLCHGSADCLLDELIWRIETWTAEDSPLWATLAPRHIGQQAATLVTSGNRLFEGAAQLLASSWPEVEESETSAVGQALLARAGAVEAADPTDLIGPIPPVVVAEVQIAEVPSRASTNF